MIPEGGAGGCNSPFKRRPEVGGCASDVPTCATASNRRSGTGPPAPVWGKLCRCVSMDETSHANALRMING